MSFTELDAPLGKPVALAANSAKHVLAELKSMHVQSVSYSRNGCRPGQPDLLSELHGCKFSNEQVCSAEFAGARELQIGHQPAAALEDADAGHPGTEGANVANSGASSLLRLTADLDHLENLNRSGNQTAQICIDRVVKHSQDLEAAAAKAKPRGSASFLRYAAEVRRGTPKLQRETAKQHADRARSVARQSWQAARA